MDAELRIEDWDRLRRELVWARRTVVEQPHRAAPYRPQGRIAAWRLLKGDVTFRLSTGHFRVPAGHWIFAGEGSGDRTFSDDAEVLSLRFRLQWLRGENLFGHHAPIVIKARAAADMDSAAFALAEFTRRHLSPHVTDLVRASSDLEHYLMLQTHFDRWIRAYVATMIKLGHAARRPPKIDPRMREAAALMESQLRAGVVLTEHRVAQAIGLSLSQFKRLFVAAMKQTPKRWLDELRLEMAHDRLRDPGKTVKQVGFELGFRSPNHFSAWFAKRGGCAPGRLIAGRGAGTLASGIEGIGHGTRRPLSRL